MFKIPRQLTANGKAKTGFAGSASRSGYEVTDRRGFVHVVGAMSTAPANESMVSDLSPRYEEFDPVRRVWLGASWSMVRRLDRMGEPERKRFLRALGGLVRLQPADATGRDATTGEHWACPRDYDADLDRADFLRKALKVGLLSLRGRTYKLALVRADTYALTRAAGTVNYTREALLQSIAAGSL